MSLEFLNCDSIYPPTAGDEDVEDSNWLKSFNTFVIEQFKKKNLEL